MKAQVGTGKNRVGHVIRPDNATPLGTQVGRRCNTQQVQIQRVETEIQVAQIHAQCQTAHGQPAHLQLQAIGAGVAGVDNHL